MKPKLRFNKGETEWKKLPLYKCGDFNPTSELPDVFEYVDLESVIGTELKQHRTEQRETAPSRAQRLARRNDIFFQMVRPYQKNNYLFTSNKDNFVFSTGYAQIRPNIDCNFLFSHLQKDSFINEVLLNCTGSSYPAINATTLSNIFITVPSNLEEQTKIGSFFTGIDAVISKTINEIERLKLVKTASLQAMFPQKGETVPRLRFKGFSEPWLICKLGSLCKQLKNNVLSRDKLNYETGIVKNIHYGDILIKFDSVIDIRKSNVPYVNSNISLDFSSSTILNNGDIIFADTAEDQNVGKCVEISGVNRLKAVSGLHTLAFRPIKKFAPYFLGYYLNSPVYRTQLLPLMQGIKVLSINRSSLQETILMVPESIEEQNAIGNFFHNIDLIINNMHRKITTLNTIKQSCLDMMFV